MSYYPLLYNSDSLKASSEFEHIRQALPTSFPMKALLESHDFTAVWDYVETKKLLITCAISQITLSEVHGDRTMEDTKTE